MTADFGFFFVILTTLYLISLVPSDDREYGPGGSYVSTIQAAGVGQ